MTVVYKVFGVFALLFFGFILWIIYQVNVGQHNIFVELAKGVPNADKVFHCILFGVLTFLANFAFHLKTINLKFLKVYLGTVLVLIFVSLEELSQAFIPSRRLDLKDFYADCIGIASATLLTVIISLVVKFVIKKRESQA